MAKTRGESIPSEFRRGTNFREIHVVVLGEVRDPVAELERLSVAIYEQGRTYARERGVLLADTKFEFGFLPGDAESKISPYMQPLWDNLNFIKNQFKANEKKSKVLEQLQDSGLLCC